MQAVERLIVIGGVAAGMSAASAARKAKPRMDALVLEKDSYISYGACSLPYYVSDEIEDPNNLLALTPDIAQSQRGIRVLTRHEALAIDPRRKQVFARNLDTGKELRLPYDKLVVATGAQPITPPLPGVNLKGIFTLRTLLDGMEIKKFITDWHSSGMHSAFSDRPSAKKNGGEKRALRAVIVGAGYIGMEMCESLRKRGLEVTVLEKTEKVLGAMDSGITELVEEKLKEEGVILHKGVSVEGFLGNDGALTSVASDKGEFDADLVLLAMGVRPNVTLAESAGIELGANGAIKVDAFLRTNIADVYAAGDCAETLHLITGKEAYIPLGTTANRQGKIAGENVAGLENAFEGVAGTAVAKVFDLEVARTGLPAIEVHREGYKYFASSIVGRSRSHAYPNGKPIRVCYTVDSETGRLLGAEMVGEEGVALRINTLAACLHARMTIEDVSRLDLGYAPPFATVWDPLLIAANVALRRWKEEEMNEYREA